MFASVLAQAAPVTSKVVMLVVKEPAGYRGGTAFVVEAPSGLYYTLSNAHVCAINQHGTMTALSQYQGKGYEGLRVLKMDKLNDLCLLDAVPHVEPIKLGHEPHPQENVVILGHPELGPLVFSEGSVTDMVAGTLHMSARVLPGNSGSPIMGRDGRIIGIINMYDQEDHSAYGITVDVIRGFLKGL